jgi:hypothetical protein
MGIMPFTVTADVRCPQQWMRELFALRRDGPHAGEVE